MNLNEWFAKGLTYEQYKENMTVNREEMETIYQDFSLKTEETSLLQKVAQQQLNVIVITEDWCGDALLNNPILMKIAEAGKMDVRFILRDQNLELMDQYLTNGTARSIPIFIFINQAGEEVAVWGPRAPKVQEMVDKMKSSLPPSDSPDFKEKQSALFKQIKDLYVNDASLRDIVSDSILEKLKEKVL
ncbi:MULTISPECIES: thioredoxin family protein [Sutcliffiella]|uniref:Thioredoxin family protein n=1 Tax=Sutcliffiella cohnii TaxID=33932 RepID=A0A223KL15_9BACI|nr:MULTISPECIES: thioredoxin family protein [Sutcliffiella]AST90199.1 thioredoxin family protein [Sutcliffiella cohnii]MED4015665.1 thioredoxin family protein [Sutcliffiella cohnii]WBL15850.1 thioredoxin family protein [Sutcliffiella sp. NC1]